MTTTQTDAIKLAIEALERNKRGLENIELFGKSNVKFSGLTEMIEKTGAALAALQAREGEVVAWHHGCNVLCADIDLWIDRCPHCGKPRPAAPAPQPAQPSEPAHPEQGHST